MANTLSDININIKANNDDLKRKVKETSHLIKRQALEMGSVGRSVLQGFAEPIARANIKNKEFQDGVLRGIGVMDKAITITEGATIAYASLGPMVGKAVVAFKALNQVQKASIIGAVIAGVAGAVAIYNELNRVLNDNSEIQKALRTVEADALKSVVEQKFKVGQLTEVFEYNYYALQDRKDAIDELIKISPQHFGSLDAEKSSYEDVMKATDSYTSAIERNARAKAAQERLVDLYKKRIDAEIRSVEAAEKKVFNAAPQFALIQGLFKKIEQSGASNELEDIRKEIAATLLIYENSAPAVEKTASATKKSTKAVKEQVEKFKGLDTIMGRIIVMTAKIAEAERKVFDDLEKGSESRLALYKVDNDSRKLTSSSISAVKSAVKNLVDQGYSVESAAIQRLLSQYDKLNQSRDIPDLDVFSSSFKENQTEAGAKILELKIKPVISNSDGVKLFFTDFQKNIEDAITIANGLSDAVSSIGSIISNQFEERMRLQDRFYDSQIEYIKRTGISEESKQAKILQLERKKERELKKLAREKAKREKEIAIFQATIQTAVGIASNLANPIAAIAAAVVGAAQIAAIASQPLPALAKGGLAFGPTQALVGDNPGANINPEVIAPLSELDKRLGVGTINVNLKGSLKASGGDLYAILEAEEVSRQRRRA